jgi:glucose-specific phosphotransferase system IIA component
MRFREMMATHKIEVLAPVDGKVVPLFDVEDDVFKNKMMGDGLAVEPASSLFLAPICGEVVFVARTRHCIAIRANDKVAVMIHMGLNTVELGGDAFRCFVKVGRKVKCGDVLAEMHLEDVIKYGKSIVTPVVIVDSKAIQVKKTTENFVRHQEKLFTVTF